MGDLALPDNKTAAGVIRDSVRTALQRRGYRVVDESSPDYATALPISVGVGQFWVWMLPAFTILKLSMESQVTLIGKELVGDAPVVVVGHVSTQPATDSMNWDRIVEPVIREGIDDLIGKIQEKIKRPAGVAATLSSSPVSKADAGY